MHYAKPDLSTLQYRNEFVEKLHYRALLARNTESQDKLQIFTKDMRAYLCDRFFTRMADRIKAHRIYRQARESSHARLLELTGKTQEQEDRENMEREQLSIHYTV